MEESFGKYVSAIEKNCNISAMVETPDKANIRGKLHDSLRPLNLGLGLKKIYMICQNSNANNKRNNNKGAIVNRASRQGTSVVPGYKAFVIYNIVFNKLGQSFEITNGSFYSVGSGEGRARGR